jgi:DNA polymerase-3 subunit epsilon
MLYPDDGRPPKRWTHYVNPERPIDREATAVHHISDEMVKDAPTFRQLAPSLAKGLTNVDFVGYNIQFDLKTTSEEMARVGVEWSYTSAFVLDGYRLWQILEPRRLEDAVRAFLHREPSNVHRADADAQDALDVVLAQIACGQTAERTAFRPDEHLVERLSSLCFPRDPNRIDPDGKFVWRGSEATITFGKHSGTLLKNLPLDYLRWMMNGTFSPEVKQLCSNALHRQFPIRSTTTTTRGGSNG